MAASIDELKDISSQLVDKLTQALTKADQQSTPTEDTPPQEPEDPRQIVNLLGFESIPAQGNPIGLSTNVSLSRVINLPPVVAAEVDQLDGLIEYPDTKTYTLVLQTIRGYTLTGLSFSLSAGTCSFQLTVDGVPVKFGLTAVLNATTFETNKKCSVPIKVSQSIEFVVTAVSLDVQDLAFSISLQRA